MNLVVLSGRLSTEPSLKYLEGSGFAISKFNLAVQKEYYKNDDDKVEFFNIECWNKLAESVANNLDKGRKRPTNSEFIATMSQYIINSYR